MYTIDTSIALTSLGHPSGAANQSKGLGSSWSVSNSSRKQLDCYAEELWRKSEFKQTFFLVDGKMLLYFLMTDPNRECVGAATEKCQGPTFILTLGKKSGLVELNDQSCLGCVAGESSVCRYVGCFDESV